MTEIKERQIRKQNITERGVVSWKLLELILKNYWEFKALLEDKGIDELNLDNGITINFHDLLKGLDELPPKQRQAIELICIQGYREVEAAKIMGYKKYSSPCGSLKRAGLRTLVRRYWNKKDENDRK